MPWGAGEGGGGGRGRGCVSLPGATALAAELKDVQADLAKAEEELGASADVLRRRDIRAPLAGTVLNLKFFTPGGVIGPGTAILDIVPQSNQMQIEVQLSPLDIDVVRPGLLAEVRLSAYKQRRMPILDGRLIQVSADRLLNERDGTPYYKGVVEVDPIELAELDDNVELYPGMPADVMIKTGERTFFQYLVSPIRDRFARACHEQ